MQQADLVQRASRGDQDAFAMLATANADRCYALAYRILRDSQRAEDATQLALLGAWRDLPTLREPERFDAWLRRLVVHACYAEARGHRRWTAHVRLISTEPRLDPDTAVSVAVATFALGLATGSGLLRVQAAHDLPGGGAVEGVVSAGAAAAPLVFNSMSGAAWQTLYGPTAATWGVWGVRSTSTSGAAGALRSAEAQPPATSRP